MNIKERKNMRRRHKIIKRLSMLIIVGLCMLAVPLGKRYINQLAVAPTLTLTEKTIKIEGPIQNLEKETKELTKLVIAGEKEVLITIDSPGGSLEAAKSFIARLKSAKYHKVRVRCVVVGTAASAALIILAHCSHRYGLFGSRIMWHSAAYSGLFRLNDVEAELLMHNLAIINDTIWAPVRRYFWPWYFTEHYKKETMLSVTEIEQNSFGFLKVVKQLKTKVPVEKADKKDKKEPVKTKTTKAKLAPMQQRKEPK